MRGRAGLIKTESQGKPRKRMRRPEQAFQKMLVHTLGFVLPRDSFLFAVPNGGRRSPIEAAIFAGQGVVPGVPDLVLLWDRRAFLMEAKADNGALSPAQVKTHARIARTGCPSAVVRTLQEALDFLRECGVPLLIKEMP